MSFIETFIGSIELQLYMADVVITNLERDCIACPTSWIATTDSNKELYIRYRWGELTIKTRDDSRDELYRQDFGGAFDGHMTVYELLDVLPSDEFEFEVSYPTSFYGFSADECTFDILGGWITGVSCTNCSWSEDSDALEKLEYETVLPPECPECGSEFTVETKMPEHLQEMQEKIERTDDDEVIDNLKENFSEE